MSLSVRTGARQSPPLAQDAFAGAAGGAAILRGARGTRKPGGMRRVILDSWALLLGIGLLMVANGLLMTLLTVRAAELGFSALVIGVMQAGYPLGALFGTLWAPRLVAQAGHVRSFAALASICSITAIVHLMTADPASWTAMRVLAGVCFPGLYVIAESWLNARTDNRLRGRVLSLYFMLQSGGSAAGAALVGWPGAAATVLFGVTSILISLSVVPLLLARVVAPQESRPEPMPLARLYAISPMAVAGAALGGAAMGVLFIAGPLYGLELGMGRGDAAAMVTAMTLAGAVAQYPIGWASDRTDRRGTLIAVSVAGAALSLAALPLGAAVTIPIFAAVAAMTVPIYSISLAHANDQLRQSQIVPASGAMVFSLNVGLLAGTFAGPAAIGAGGTAGFPLLMALLLAAAAAVSLRRRALSAAPAETGRAQAVGSFGAPQTAFLQSEAAVAEEDGRAGRESG